MQPAKHITSEYGLLRADGVIELRHNLILVLIGNQAVQRSAAGIVCCWQRLHDVHRHRIQQARRDLVVDESEVGRQRSLYPVVATGSGEGGEIALKRCGSGNEGGVLNAVGSERRSLIAA